VCQKKIGQALIFPLTGCPTEYNLFNYILITEASKVKTSQFYLAGLLILFLALGGGCAKKVIRSEATPYTVSQPTPQAVETQPAPKPEVKVETLTPEKPEGPGEKAGIKEESLEEKALREKALREEAARREAAAQKTEMKKSKLESIYFDFDLWMIRDDQKEIMVKDAEWLKADPRTKIRIEGNCDERGSSEYNLALGQKRAEAAKGFLKGLGITENRMETISYGEERPLDPGHDEAAWAKNRRVDFVPIR
jgi:peptidoglycan-associated lipoprotein